MGERGSELPGSRRRLACRRRRSTAFRRSFSKGWRRGRHLGDVGESSPEHWEKPLGSRGRARRAHRHIARTREHLEPALRRARATRYEKLGVTAIWRQDCHAPPDEKEAFGFKDGISHPAIEGSGIPGTQSERAPLKAGEFVSDIRTKWAMRRAIPQPEILGRNGSYVVFRKLHQRVAAFRQYLKSNAADPEHEE